MHLCVSGIYFLFESEGHIAWMSSQFGMWSTLSEMIFLRIGSLLVKLSLLSEATNLNKGPHPPTSLGLLNPPIHVSTAIQIHRPAPAPSTPQKFLRFIISPGWGCHGDWMLQTRGFSTRNWPRFNNLELVTARCAVLGLYLVYCSWRWICRHGSWWDRSLEGFLLI